MIDPTNFILFYGQINTDTLWEASRTSGPYSQHSERVDRTPNMSLNGQMQLSFSSDHTGSVKVSDAIEMCKAQLLKQSVESPSQSASYQQTENSCL